ncbi:MAG: hypothetical protein JW888_05980 [Pirellulales bacterium]|nr:hypothetical protein [Pirellulales bacterium]
MAIPVQCPNCRKSIAAPDEYAGKKVKCRCGTVFVVPAPVATPSASPDSLFDSLDEASLEGPALASPTRRRASTGGSGLGRLAEHKLAVAVAGLSLGWLVLVIFMFSYGARWFFLVLPAVGFVLAGCRLRFPTAKRRGPFGPWFRRPFVPIAILSGVLGLILLALPFLLMLAAKCGIHLPQGMVSVESRDTVHGVAYFLVYVMFLSFGVCFLSLGTSIALRLARQHGPWGAANALYLGLTSPLLLLLGPVCLLGAWSEPSHGRPPAHEQSHMPPGRSEQVAVRHPNQGPPPGHVQDDRPSSNPRPTVVRTGPGQPRVGSHGRSPTFTGTRSEVCLNLLQVAAVQEDLRLSTAQNQKIDAFASETTPSAETERRNMQNMSTAEWRRKNEEMNRRGGEMRRERDRKIDAAVNEILRPDQLERLGQIWLQVAGTAALSNSEVQEKLGITDQQKDEMQAVRDAHRAVMHQSLRNTSREERARTRDERRGRGRKLVEDLMGILTPDQKAKLEQMKGKKLPIDRSRPNASRY